MISRVRINLPGAPMSSPFPYDRGVRQGSVEGPDMWNQVLDNALREPAARWEAEGIGFKLATAYRRKKCRRPFSGEDMKGADGPVLHHLCWADDLYAMAGSIEHLIRILIGHDQCSVGVGHEVEGEKLEDCCRTLHKLQVRTERTRLSAKMVEKYIWHVVDGMEALGTWLDNRGGS